MREVNVVPASSSRGRLETGLELGSKPFQATHIYIYTIGLGLAFNPLVFACQQDEDTVGKVSRLSRRVNIRKVMDRTLRRYRVQAKTAFKDAGLLF